MPYVRQAAAPRMASARDAICCRCRDHVRIFRHVGLGLRSSLQSRPVPPPDLAMDPLDSTGILVAIYLFPRPSRKAPAPRVGRRIERRSQSSTRVVTGCFPRPENPAIPRRLHHLLTACKRFRTPMSECRPILHRVQLRLGHRSQQRPSWSGDISTLDSRVAAPWIGTPAPQEAAPLSEHCARRSAPQPASY